MLGDLFGRDEECAALDRLVTAVKAGQSRVLVVRGRPGVGKTALLDYLAARAGGDVLRVAGVEAEAELAFAGLQRLCAPLLPALEKLPQPQQDALAAAFGLKAYDAPDPFLLGLAVHGLVTAAGAPRALVCIVDDAQWLDTASAQTLAFVARRLQAESVGLVFALRVPDLTGCVAGLPTLDVFGLADEHAQALLGAALPAPLDIRIRDRIIAETAGNAKALLDTAGGLSPEELAGGFGLADAVPESAEESFRERIAALPPATRRLLLVAAAEPAGDPALIWRAAPELGIDPSAAAVATSAGLIQFGSLVRFQHAATRAAAYWGAPSDDRRLVHLALANATDSSRDPDRRAWHLAHTTTGVDEDIAAALERSADSARERGGLAASAAFLERATELTPDPALRARRSLAAANCKHLSGAQDGALRLLAVAEAGPLSDLERARALLLRARISSVARPGRDAAAMLLDAGRSFESLDPMLAQEAYLDALTAALYAAELTTESVGVREIGEAVLDAHARGAVADSPRHRASLLVGVALLATQGCMPATPRLQEALCHFRNGVLSEEEGLRWLCLACWVARALGDDEAWDELSDKWVRVAHDSGGLSLLPLALDERAKVELAFGDRTAAQAVISQAETTIETNRSRFTLLSPAVLAAWQGPGGEALRLIPSVWSRATLLNGVGRWEEALAASQSVAQQPDQLPASTWACAELVEAAARSGSMYVTDGPLERLAEFAHASGSAWALGIEARSRALVNGGVEAERLYGRAIDHLSRTRIKVDLARAHLVYGEWLRREGRRVDAREHLRTAYDLLSGLGADGFAARARRELLATGETVRKRIESTRGDLTAQEAEIARLAAQGRTNPEIGACLFISPRTVQYHLRKVFRKLDVRSRNELRAALPADIAIPRAVAA